MIRFRPLLRPSSLRTSSPHFVRLFPRTTTSYSPQRFPPPYPNANGHVPPPPRKRFPLFRYICFGVFLALGWKSSTVFLHPPVTSLAQLERELDSMPVVQELRMDPEIWQEHEAYSSSSPEEKANRFSSGPLGGPGGFAVQRVFVNERDSRAITIVWIGPNLSGWPGVTHGGAIATLMDEACGRVAIAQFPGRTGVTAELTLRYDKPTWTGVWYVIDAAVLTDERLKSLYNNFKYVPPQEEMPDYMRLGASGPTKAWVVASLCNKKGAVTANALGLFVVPKALKLQEIKEGF